MQYKTVTYAFSTLLLSSTALAATPSAPAPSPNVICNVDYSTNAAAQAIAEQCCNSAGGVPVDFKEAKIQGCNNFLLRSPRNLMFVGCIQDNLHEEPACYNAAPAPTTTPTAVPSPNVICTVDYSTHPADQETIEQCCNSNGGVPVNFRESKIEGCNNFLLRSPENLGFVGCIEQNLHKTPACYNAAPAPVSTASISFTHPNPATVTISYTHPNPESVSISFTHPNPETPTISFTHPNPMTVTNSFTHPNPITVSNSFTHPTPITVSNSFTHPNPVKIANPTVTPVYCDISYGSNTAKQHYVASCCSQAGGKAENISSRKIERCDNLILRGTVFDKYVGCLYKKNLNPACYPSSATSTATTSTHFSTHPHPSVVSSPTATASVAPVPTDAICTVDYSRKAINQKIVDGCCQSAGGSIVNFREAKLEGCQDLKLGSKGLDIFGKCVKSKTTTVVNCQTQ